MNLVRLKYFKIDAVKLPHTRPPVGHRVACYFGTDIPSLGNVVDYFLLVMHWDYKNPMDSIVELRCHSRLDKWGSYLPIDPNIMRLILSKEPKYANAIVDIAPGRTFFKGLCGDYAAQLDRYDERTSDSLAGSLVSNHGLELAVALSFPGKIKSLWEARCALKLINTVGDFVEEMRCQGNISSNMKELKAIISKTKYKIEEYDTYIREDHKTFNECVSTLQKFGIDYNA